MRESLEPIVTFSQELTVTVESDNMDPMTTIDEKQRFSDRLNRVLDQAGVPPKGKGRQDAVAEMFKVSQKGARKWLEGEAIPDTKRIPEFIEKFKLLSITGEWLFHGNPLYAPEWVTEFQEKKHLHMSQSPAKYDVGIENIIEINKQQGNVPLISYVQAGSWCEAIDNYPPGDAESWWPCPVQHGKNTYALRVIGDSMTSPYPGQRSYPEGSIIYVDPDVQVTSGRRVIAKLPENNEVTFKEYRYDNGKHWLKPLNPQYQTIEITEETHFCGVVIGQFMPE